MGQRKKRFDEMEYVEVEPVKKQRCQDCYRIDWEFAYTDENNQICKCDKCHELDKETGEYKPKTLH